MTKMTFESIYEYLEDHYTAAELIDQLNIPIDILLDYLLEYIRDERSSELAELLQNQTEEQLEFEFF